MPLYVCNRATSIDAVLISASTAEGAALKFAELRPEDGRFIQVRKIADGSREDFLPSSKIMTSVQRVAGTPAADPGDVADKAD